MNEKIIEACTISIDGIIVKKYDSPAVNLVITDKDSDTIINVPVPLDFAKEIAMDMLITARIMEKKEAERYDDD